MRKSCGNCEHLIFDNISGNYICDLTEDLRIVLYSDAYDEGCIDWEEAGGYDWRDE